MSTFPPKGIVVSKTGSTIFETAFKRECGGPIDRGTSDQILIAAQTANHNAGGVKINHSDNTAQLMRTRADFN